MIRVRAAVAKNINIVMGGLNERKALLEGCFLNLTANLNYGTLCLDKRMKILFIC